MKIMAAVVAVAALAISAPAAAQMKAVKWAGKPVFVIMVKFKPSTIDRIDEIETKYFAPAAQTVGYGQPTIVNFVAGDWDREYIFPMIDGMDGLAYKMTDRGVAFMTAIGKIAGSPAAAKKINDEWDASVDHSTSYIGFSDGK